MGLSECQGVVRQHGGKIEVESELGKGTLVRVMLPISVSDPDGAMRFAEHDGVGLDVLANTPSEF